MTGVDSGEQLGELALSRGTVDRATERRTDVAWLDAAWADPATRVLVVSDGQALARAVGEHMELVFVSPGEAPDGVRMLLGEDTDGEIYFGVSALLPAVSASGEPLAKPARAASGEVRAEPSTVDARGSSGSLPSHQILPQHTRCTRCCSTVPWGDAAG